MRKNFGSLAAATRLIVGEEPLNGHLFVFLNRRGDRVEILSWDRNGWLLIYSACSTCIRSRTTSER